MEKYTCTKIVPNSRMGNECYDGRTIFYFDRKEVIKVGDKVQLERLPNGNYGKIIINT